MASRLYSVVSATMLLADPAAAQQVPLVTTGGMARQLSIGDTLAVNPSTAGDASLNIPHGTTPTSPNNGDVWTTSAGVSVRVNGYTLPPLAGVGNTPSLTVGTSIYPTNLGGIWTRYDATSNVLANVVGAKSGYFGAAAKDGLTWAETYLPGIDTQTPHSAQLYSLSTSGNYGASFGSRSSDNTLKSEQNIIGMIGLGVADHTTQPHRVWGGYSAAYQAEMGKQTILIGHEVTTDNRAADSPAVTPANPNPLGAVNGLRMTCGDGELAKHYLCSSAISTAYNGAAYRTGLLFADGSVSKARGYADAIAMPNDYGISWNAGGSVPEWRIFSNAGPMSYTNSVVFGVNTIDFYLAGGGARPLHLSSEGAVTSGTHQLVATTFARLPICDTDHAGSMAFINDAQVAITTWSQVVNSGGGSNKAFVKCNGTSWNAF